MRSEASGFQAGALAASERRWAAAVAALLGLLAIAPFWTVRNVATVDGPAHFLNAGIFRSLLLDPASPYRDIYFISWSPLPYWTQTITLSLLLQFLSGPTAHRLLLSAFVLALPLALARLRREIHGAAGAPALLALPLATGYLLHLGLYNFCFGTVLLLAFLASYWRDPQPRSARLALLAGWLVALWFTHLLAWGVAAGALLGAALLLALRRRSARPLTALIALLPTLPLAIWYLSVAVGQRPRGAPSFESLFDQLLAGGIFVGYARSERIGVPLLLLAIVLLLVDSVRSELAQRRLDEGTLVFGAAAAAALILVVVAPRWLADGSLVRPRFVFLFLLFLLAAVAAPSARLLSLGVIAATFTFLVYRIVAVVPAYRMLDREVRAMEQCLAVVDPGARVKTSLLRPPLSARNPHFPLTPNAQGIAWDALARGWIDFGDDFPSRSFMPVRALPDRIPHSKGSPDLRAASWAIAYDVDGYDALFFWGFPPTWTDDEEFERRFELRARCPAGGVAVRREGATAEAARPH